MFEVDKIREQFPILKRKIKGKDLVFLDSGATSQKPEVVIEAMNRFYRETNANIHRGVYEMSVESTKAVDDARASVASLIGAESREIIFTRNTSESINLVAYSWGEDNLRAGDMVITTMLEHHSNLIPWQELARRKGADLGIISIDSEANLNFRDEVKEVGDERGLRVITGGWEELLSPRVKMVAVTGVSNVMGTIVPLKKLVELIKRLAPEAKILVDGAQMVPHMKVEVKSLGVDFLAFSSHKMVGPTGVGVLWGKTEILNKMRPFLYGGDMIGEVTLTGSTWAEIPSKFEAGTPDIAGIVGLGTAAEYLKQIGMDNIRNHEKELIEYALEKMSVLEKEGMVTVYGPRDVSVRGGALPFNVKGIHAHDAAQVLDSYGIAVRSGQHCAAPLVLSFGEPAMVRATIYLYNTKEEIDFLVDKIREIPKVFA